MAIGIEKELGFTLQRRPSRPIPTKPVCALDFADNIVSKYTKDITVIHGLE